MIWLIMVGPFASRAASMIMPSGSMCAPQETCSPRVSPGRMLRDDRVTCYRQRFWCCPLLSWRHQGSTNSLGSPCPSCVGTCYTTKAESPSIQPARSSFRPTLVRNQLRRPMLSRFRFPAQLAVWSTAVSFFGGNGFSVCLESPAVKRMPLPCQKVDENDSGNQHNDR